MNGSENGFAGTLFFSLIAVGAILKIEDAAGLAVAAICAIAAATCLRRAILQKEMATEDDHQRIEIQFQQLRQKINEGYSATTHAMNAITDTSEVLQENLQEIRTRLASLENLTSIAETASAMGSAMKSVEDTNATIEINVRRLSEKLSDVANAVEKNSETINNLSKNMSTDLQKLAELGEEHKNALQTGIKLVQVVGQMLKNPGFVKNLETMQTSVDGLSEKVNTLGELKKSFEVSHEKSAELIGIVGEISNQNMSMIKAISQMENVTLASAKNFKNVGDEMVKGMENLTSMFDDVRQDLGTLTKKLDAYNGLARATLDQYTNLTEQDVRILERISEKFSNGRK